jgi:hypothetical protein
MSDYREIKIIINIVGKDNIMTDEQARMVSGIIDISVSELVTVDEVAEEIKKRMLSIEDVL